MKHSKTVRGERLELRHYLTNVGFGPHDVDLTPVAGPSQVETADFDRDGDLDLLVASWWDSKVSWFEKVSGRGAYVPHLVSDEQLSAHSASPADIDGDGDLDVLVTSTSEQMLVWFENTDGRGGFGIAQPITERALQVGPGQVADMDQDGDLDVVVPEYETKLLTWYENTDAKGTFGDKRIISSDNSPKGYVALGDIDLDGDIDVVSSALQGGTSWYAHLDGRGNFSDAQSIFSLGQPTHLHDLDSDGDLDLVGGSRWFKNDGLGTFRASDPIGFDDAFSVADIDTDGDLDIVTGHSWYRNVDGQGNFSSQLYDVPQYAGPVAVADLDGDGDLDMLHAIANYDNSLAWRENRDGKGDFGPRELITSQGKGATYTTTADVDGDHDLDLIIGDDSRAELAIYKNQGNGTFGPRTVIAQDYFTFIEAADIDGDGDIDLATSYLGDTVWFRNLDGQGAFSEPQVIAKQASAISLDASHIDGDGDLDFVVARRNEISWYSNANGTGQFAMIQSIDGVMGDTFQVSVLAVDLDSDGDQDIAFGAAGIGWLENLDGRGTFGGAHTIAAEGSPALVAADFDGDGDWDLAAAHSQEGTVGWYANEGRGHFTARQIIASQMDRVESLFAGDVDGDGDSDLLLATSHPKTDAWYRGAVYWLENLGAANFATPHTVARDTGRVFYDHAKSSVTAADLDSDGDLDVVSAVSSGILIAPGQGQITWHENRLVGDINRDDLFDSSDLVAALQAGEYNDRAVRNSTFDEGDWNGDGEFDSSDLIMAFQSGRYQS